MVAAQQDLAKLATAVAASGPLCWTLKGEGNANLVLAYTGTDPALVSQRTFTLCLSHFCCVCSIPASHYDHPYQLAKLGNPLVLGIK